MEKTIVVINPSIYLKVCKADPNKVQLVDNLHINRQIRESALLPYINTLYSSLLQHSEKKQKGIPKYAVCQYLSLPGLIGERLFKCFDQNNDGYLDRREFIGGFEKLFGKSFEEHLQLVFTLYDFDGSRKISREDLRTLLSHVPITRIYSCSMLEDREGDKTPREKPLPFFMDRLQSQAELVHLIEMFMGEKEYLTYEDFVNLTEKVSSTFFLCIFLLIRKICPVFCDFSLFCSMNKITIFNSNSPIKLEKGSFVASPIIEACTKLSPLSEFQKISSTTYTPSHKESALKRINRLKTKEQNNYFNSLLPKEDKKLEEINQDPLDDEDDSVPNEHNEEIKSIPIFTTISKSTRSPWLKITTPINTTGLSPITPLPSMDGLRQIPRRSLKLEAMEEKKEDTSMVCACEGQCHSSYEECVKWKEKMLSFKHTGYLYERINEDTLNRSFYQLVGNSLFRYDTKGDTEPSGIFHIGSCLVKEEEEVRSNGFRLHPFRLTISNNQIVFHSLKKEERDAWVRVLKEAAGYVNMTDYYELGEPLGQGKFGVVRLAVEKKSGNRVAVKIIRKSKMSILDLGMAKREIEILKMCQHPNIIKIHDTFENSECIFIVMEWLKGGDLYDYFEKRKFNLKEERICTIIHALATALFYLQIYGIIHRDIKLDNILMDSNREDSAPKLVDFGLSQMLGPGELTNEPYGTFGYSAPEILLGRPYDKSVDVWSLGVVLYILFCSKSPFDMETARSDEVVAWKTVHQEPSYEGTRWEKYSEEGKQCVMRMLSKDPRARLSLQKLLIHPWIEKFFPRLVEIRKKVSPEMEFCLYSVIEPPTSTSLQKE